MELIKENIFFEKIEEKIEPHYRFGKLLSVQTLFTYYSEFEEPILPIKGEGKILVKKIYYYILKLINLDYESKQSKELLEKLMFILKDVKIIIKDEIYLTIIKLYRYNRNDKLLFKLWQFFSIISSFLECSTELFYLICNFFTKIISNKMLDEDNENLLKFSLNNLYVFKKYNLYRNFPCFSHEIKHILNKILIPIKVYLQNNESLDFNINSYYKVENLKIDVLKKLNIDKIYMNYFEIFEYIDYGDKLKIKYLNDRHFLCDLLSNWYLLKKDKQEIKCFIYVKLLINPNLNKFISPLNEKIYYNFKFLDFVFCLKNELYEIEANDFIEIISYIFQIEYGEYSSHNKITENILENYLNNYELSNFSINEWVSKVTKIHKKLQGKTKLQMYNLLFEFIEKNYKIYNNSNIFKCKFHKSNMKNYNKEDIDRCLLVWKSDKIIIINESNFDIIEEINFNNILNWGINNDIFVICFGEKIMINKIYFKIKDTYLIHKILTFYTSFEAGNEINFKDYDYINFQKDWKNKKFFIFKKKIN